MLVMAWRPDALVDDRAVAGRSVLLPLGHPQAGLTPSQCRRRSRRRHCACPRRALVRSGTRCARRLALQVRLEASAGSYEEVASTRGVAAPQALPASSLLHPCGGSPPLPGLAIVTTAACTTAPRLLLQSTCGQDRLAQLPPPPAPDGDRCAATSAAGSSRSSCTRIPMGPGGGGVHQSTGNVQQ